MRKFFGISGSSFIITVISFTIILGFASLVIDIGLTLFENQKLSNALDAASLAGAQSINQSDIKVMEVVNEYASINGINPETLNISISPDRKSVEVESSKVVKHFFARALGINQSIVSKKSTSKVAPLTSYSGIRPLVIQNQVLVYGEQYILKDGAGDAYSGNYGAISLGGNGSSVYENNIINGYSGIINVGDEIFTETGNIAQTTRRAIQTLIDSDPISNYTSVKDDSKRLIIIPIVDTLDVDGKKPIYVLGFASFFVEELGQSGGHTEIFGRFVKHVVNGDSSDQGVDYGLLGVKLVK